MKIHLLIAVGIFVLPSAVSAQINRYSQPAKQTIINTRPSSTSPDLNLMRQALEARQARYDNEVAECQNQTKAMYEAAGTYPATSSLLDGSYNAVTMTSGLCVTRQVFIRNGKAERMIHEDGSSMAFNISTPIINGKCTATRSDAETNTSIYYTIYLMEEIFRK